jgi:hypothetical protein
LALLQICYNAFFVGSGTPKITAEQKVVIMVEFTSEPQKRFPTIRVLIALGICLILLTGGLLFIRHQRNAPPRTNTTSIVVPGVIRAGNTDFEYYKNKIRIESIKASLGISFSSARIAMISGIIVNDGSRKLEALEMKFTLYDVWGKFSKERTVFVLRPGMGYNNKPMEPLERRTFSIGIESVEYYWNPKQVTYEITGLKYQ